MTRMILLDTNLLINAFDREEGDHKREAARLRLEAWLRTDSGVKLAITPLILHEVLRGLKNISPDELKEKLEGFQEFDICASEAHRAAELYCLAKEKGLFQPSETACPTCGHRPPSKDACPTCGHYSLDKHSFDIFHCACADVNGLEIESDDRHIKRLRQLIQDTVDSCGSTASQPAIPQEN